MPVLLMLSLVACGGKEVTFPAGLEPLPDAVVACPSDPSAESVATEGTRTDESFAATACGHVVAPFDDVVAAIQTPEAGVDRRAVNVEELTITFDVEPEYDVSYAVDTIVHDAVEVNYTLSWRHGRVDDGTHATRWQMTVTSPCVTMIEGSVSATDDDGTATLQFVEHSVKALAHGEELPTWE